MKDPGLIPRGVLMWNLDSPISVVSLHWWPWRDPWSLWLRLRRLHPGPSLVCHTDNVIIPLDLTQLFCPGFTLAAGPPSSFTTTYTAAGGEPCGEPTISLHSHTVSLLQWVNPLLPFMMDPGSIPRGVIMWNRDSLLALSRYNNLILIYVVIINVVTFFTWHCHKRGADCSHKGKWRVAEINVQYSRDSLTRSSVFS